MSLTGWHSAIVALLQADLQQCGFIDEQIEFVDGFLDGPVERRDQAAAWLESGGEDSRYVDQDQILLVVRIFKSFQQKRAPETPIITTELEGIVETMQATLKAHPAGVGGTWMNRLTTWKIDPGKQMVEARISAWLANPGVV